MKRLTLAVGLIAAALSFTAAPANAQQVGVGVGVYVGGHRGGVGIGVEVGRGWGSYGRGWDGYGRGWDGGYYGRDYRYNRGWRGPIVVPVPVPVPDCYDCDPGYYDYDYDSRPPIVVDVIEEVVVVVGRDYYGRPIERVERFHRSVTAYWDRYEGAYFWTDRRGSRHCYEGGY